MNVYFCRRDVPCTNTAKVANFGADKAQPDFIPQREALATVLHYTLVLIFPTIILCARRRARENGGAFRRLITSEKKDILHFTATYWCDACACVFMDIYIYNFVFSRSDFLFPSHFSFARETRGISTGNHCSKWIISAFFIYFYFFFLSYFLIFQGESV